MAAIRKKNIPAAAKTTAAKLEEPKTEVKATELKKAETPTTPVKTEEVKKETEKAVKVTAAKSEKKAPSKSAKKTPAKKTELKSQICVQFDGKSYTQEDLVKIAKDVWKYDLKQKTGDLTSVELYVKPEESMVYYVINKEVTGSFSI